MFVVRNYVTMGGTVACALAIGYLMQYGPAAQKNAMSGQDEVIVASNAAVDLTGIKRVVLTASTSAANTSFSESGTTENTSRFQPRVAQKCALSARAKPAPDATATLSIKAPCHENATLEIHHNGLIFNTVTNEEGAARLTVPVMAEYAIFLISMGEDGGTVATTHVPEVRNFDRVALQWTGDTALQLHALEFGASYGQPGHVWANPEASGAGSMVGLGLRGLSESRNVEVYSFPKSSTSSGTIELSIEAEVTASNCDSELAVQSLELRDALLTTRDLSLTLPDCSQAGQFLVLNNLLQDLTIAAK
ncbi:hypothetical protein [Ruegeria sp. HKCCD7255]|uniref:hypothetical protein n=1 Tax=Ruegeria sp. HKCCD7255 TaxID=2683004 RepID=UPI001487B3D7|nr:hypothetical protein [Ruegeria sp. HKCCD7255]